MLNKGKNIEELFGKAFQDAEVTPPSNMWDNLETSLNHSVESIYKNSFENSSVAPSKKVWNRIAYVLFIRNFLQFNPKTFNVYYTAFTALVGVVCFSVFSDKSETKNSIQSTEIKQEISNNTTNTSTIESQKSGIEITKQSHNVTISNTPEKSNQVKVVEISKNDFTKSDSKKNSSVSTFDFSKITILGKSTLCTNSDGEYTIEGVPVNAEIEWNLNQKDGFIKFISTRKISALWNKSGTYAISALITVDNTTKKIEMPVTVVSAAIPVIKGKNKVCEGQEKQLYSIDEPVDKQIQYNWKTKFNQIDFKGNKYINIDWTKSGKDTLFVTKINNETGCISKSFMPIQILPKPSIDFEMTPLGNNEFEFRYIGNVKKSNAVSWIIDGYEYNDNIITHENKGMNNSIIQLSVKDNNNCISTLQREVSFNKNIIFVPRQFNLNDEDGFMPQTNNSLKSYKIEIYNARNEKIWESTELSQGKPAKAWDGQYKGNSLPRGKYYWRINATFEDGSVWKGVKQPTGETKPNGIFILED